MKPNCFLNLNARIYLQLIVILLLLLLVVIPIPTFAENATGECVASGPEIGGAGDEPSITGGSDDIVQSTQISGTVFSQANILRRGSLARIVEDITGTDLVTQNGGASVLVVIVDDFSNSIGQRTHGDYVLDVATAAYYSVYNGHGIEIHIADYATVGQASTVNDAEAAIENTLENIQNKAVFKTIVYNWSWVILPCKQDSLVLDLGDIGGEFFGSTEVTFSYDMNLLAEFRRESDENAATTLIEFMTWQRLRGESGYNGIQLDQIDPKLLMAVGRQFGIFLNTPYLSSEEVSRQYILEDFDKLPSIINPQSSLYKPEHEDVPTNGFENLESVIPIAASGNMGQDSPYAPAAWSEVLAVGGHWANSVINEDVEADSIWPKSNGGQVSAPAAWHPTITNEYLSGTSFATPLVSVLGAYVEYYNICVLSGFLEPNATKPLDNDDGPGKEFTHAFLLCNNDPSRIIRP